MLTIRATTLILLASVLATPLQAQRIGAWPETWDAPAEAIPPVRGEAGEKPASGSGLVLGGVAGFFSTALVSLAAYDLSGGGRVCGDDRCGFASALGAFFLGEPFLVPAGVHLANRRRGSYTIAAAVSSVIWLRLKQSYIF